MAKITTMSQAYNRTISKIRTLWNTALQLIGIYEDFDRKLSDLETKIDELSTRINSTIDGTPDA